MVGKRSAGHKKGWPVVTICPSSFAGWGKGPGGLCRASPALLTVLEEVVLGSQAPPPPQKTGGREVKKDNVLTLRTLIPYLEIPASRARPGMSELCSFLPPASRARPGMSGAATRARPGSELDVENPTTQEVGKLPHW